MLFLVSFKEENSEINSPNRSKVFSLIISGLNLILWILIKFFMAEILLGIQSLLVNDLPKKSGQYANLAKIISISVIRSLQATVALPINSFWAGVSLTYRVLYICSPNDQVFS